MQRDVTALTDNRFDLLIVGGGIYGAWVAWDAALRGLQVALIDQGDFGHATSANSLKTVHGGLRYLQDGDFGLVRLMIQERATLLRVAPHLVHPLPCVMPTYARFMRSRWVMGAALTLNNLLSLDHNQLPDPQKRLPLGRLLSRADCLALLPGVADAGITGGACWYDAQMYNSERLTLAVVRSAAVQGAVVVNYVAAIGFLGTADQVTGIQARDQRSGAQFAVRARLVINATGAGMNRLLGFLGKRAPGRPVPLSPAMNLVIRRRLLDCAAGVPSWPNGSGRDSQPSRLLFMAPWRAYTLIGTTHGHYRGSPDAFRVAAADVAAFLTEINSAYPGAALTLGDVVHVHSGFLPAHPDQTSGVRLVRRSQVLDHQRTGGVAGLLSIVGVKYTSARHAAQKAVDLALAKLGMAPVACRTHSTPLFGGRIDRFDHFLAVAMRTKPQSLSELSMRRLVYNYGDHHRNVLAPVDETGVDT
ncbi:MAG: glycerol-3-phosphate dehydrogenase/oxidase, partial [Caldilineaceae bacterium]|nr:glycerol-3-phosphate dehydrogenase/oxidase [Caldilineaceae bacterium]